MKVMMLSKKDPKYSPIRTIRRRKDVQVRRVDKAGLFYYQDEGYQVLNYTPDQIIRLWIDTTDDSLRHVSEEGSLLLCFRKLGEKNWRK